MPKHPAKSNLTGANRLAIRLMLGGAIAAAALSTISGPARAVPAFTDQTGMPCQSCHVGSFGPQLTPLGREFKLGGYTLRAKPFNLPLSAMAIASLTHTARDQAPPPDNLNGNDNLVFDQGSLFLAGGLGQHLGGFAQFTYDGVGKAWAWDNLDLRAVTHGRLFGQDGVFGLTLNNSPTIQDSWNSTPSWGFPYTDTGVSPTPGATPLIDGGLAQNVIGLGAYAWIGRKFYLEGGAYASLAAGTLNWLGMDPAAPGDIAGLAPYGRAAVQTNFGGGTLELGALALSASIHPARDRSTPFTDHYTDYGLDASWQKTTATNDTIALQARYVHQETKLRASCELGLIGAGGNPDCADGHLDEWRGDATYSWRNHLNARLAGFATSGSTNVDLYGDSGRPDSSGIMAQVDYTPWGDGTSPLGPRVNLQIGVQYTAYGKFDGTTLGASGNNALRVFSWIAF